MNLKKSQRIVTGLAAAGVAAFTVLSGAVPAHASVGGQITIQTNCGESRDAEVPGGAAHWTANCSGGEFYVSGWIADTREDGKCVRVKAKIGSADWRYSKSACPMNDTETFGFPGTGKSASILLFTYDV